MRNYTGGIPSYKWNTIQAILSSYENMKKEYAQRTSSILLSSPSPPDGQPKGTNISDTTGDKATALNSPFMVRLLANIIAVETAFEKLNKVEQEFVRQYFFEGRRYIDCDIRVRQRNRKIKYLSVRTLSNICKRVVYAVGRELGEIE